MSKKKKRQGLIIDGVIGSEAIDSSGEILEIEGVDLSSLDTDDGILLNYEHKTPKDKSSSFNDIIGRCIEAKKIFKRSDCDNDRERSYWDKVKVPFIYGKFELFDAEGHPNASAAAAIIRHYHYRKLPVTIRYSIEGSTLEKEGNRLKKTICRAVASTIKPCNKTAFSGVLLDPQEDTNEEDLFASILKFEDPDKIRLSTVELDDLDPVFSDPEPLTKEEAASRLAEMLVLSKTLTAGNYDVAPSTLTGGAALAKEDLDKKKIDVFKNQFLAAVRDWDKASPFRNFLKTRMPECDDEYIDYFSDLVEDITVKKSQELGLHKKEEDQLGNEGVFVESQLREAANTIKAQKSQPILFRGRHVDPGEIEFVSGTHIGTKLPMVHKDWENTYILNEVGQIQKLKNTLENKVFRVNTKPQKAYVPIQIKTDVGSFDLGGQTEMAPMGAKPGQTSGIGWYRTEEGPRVFVKPALKMVHDPTPLYDDFSTARREALFYDVAKNIFGLEGYVPPTSVFLHPLTADEYSAQAEVVGGSHPFLIFQNKAYVPKRGTPTSNEILKQGKSGALHKLALMDYILGNSDRTTNNYLVVPGKPNGVQLIDNSFSLASEGSYPAYLEHFDYLTGQQESLAHPSAIEMAVNLDPHAIGKHLTDKGVPAPLVEKAVRRAALARVWAKNAPNIPFAKMIQGTKE